MFQYLVKNADLHNKPINICQIFAKYLPVYSSLLNFQFRNCDVNFIYCRGDREAARSGLSNTCIYIYLLCA